jgi:hypothetical protein
MDFVVSHPDWFDLTEKTTAGASASLSMTDSLSFGVDAKASADHINAGQMRMGMRT